MASPVLDRSARAAVACVVAAGAGLAISGLLASAVHHRSGQTIGYLVVAAALSGVAVLVRRVRWVTIVCLIGLAGQVIAVAGTLWELTHPIASVKTVQLQAIGIDPTAATVVNLCYSATAFGVFCWIAARRWAANRCPRPPQQEPGQR
jgi:hypothetical protein